MSDRPVERAAANLYAESPDASLNSLSPQSAEGSRRMAQSIDVCLLPCVVAPEQLIGHTVVVIDVLRATTTIAQAMASGAAKVIPCLEVEEALAQAEKLGRENVILGGERGGLLIEGFDLGNSPRSYTNEAVGGRTVVFTTTNGTAALLHCRQADKIVLGSLVNLSAVVDAVSSADKLTIVCAGTRGLITREDVFAAGAIIERLTSAADRQCKLSPTASIAHATWQSIEKKGISPISDDKPRTREAAAKTIGLIPFSAPQMIAAAMRETRGGRDLVHLGLDRDIVVASRVDGLVVVPCYDPASGVIRLQ